MKLPAVVLIDPKYPHNVGGALRACAAFGVSTLRWTGRRVDVEHGRDRRILKGTGRLPREERMSRYAVEWEHASVLDVLAETSGTPVAVEICQGAEPLTTFEHPDDAVYVFGPEDGSISKAIRYVCHRFVVIPTAHCLNLAAAVNVVLYDRRVKRQRNGLEPIAIDQVLKERRAWFDDA